MTDIVEMLRQGSLTRDDYRWKAADEIERLQNELHIAQEWSSRVIAGHEEDIREITRLTARVEELETRLEVDPSHPYDGIYCRDETIRGQEKQIARLTARVEELEAALNRLTTRLYEDLDGGRKLRRGEVDKARAALTQPAKGGE
jgi:predicted RNase H-like nuclease (RuvC/YqgF family)